MKPVAVPSERPAGIEVPGIGNWTCAVPPATKTPAFHKKSCPIGKT